MKLLVVGASGQVGRSIVERAGRRGDEVVAAYNSRRPALGHVPVALLDKTNADRCRVVLEEFRPEAVVDTGALHNVDFCESHPDEARRVNTEGTRNLASATAKIGARFVFVSTDFVFDGMKSGPYTEADAPRPVSVYAESKLGGELATGSSMTGALIVRPSVIYSWLDSRTRAESSSGKGLNFGTWLVEEVAHGRPVRIIVDQTASPTLAEDLAGAIIALLDHGCEGIYHTAGKSATSRYKFSTELISRLGLDTNLVQPVHTSDLNQMARRPVNSSLSCDRLTEATGYRMLDLPAALDRFARSYDGDPGAPGRGH